MVSMLKYSCIVSRYFNILDALISILQEQQNILYILNNISFIVKTYKEDMIY